MTCRYWNFSWPNIIFHNQKSLLWSNSTFQEFFNFSYSSFLTILVLKAANIELNPGPNQKSYSYFSCCHWNVYSLLTDNCKVAALKSYNSICKYGFICISETFINSSFDVNVKDLVMEGYNLIWSDHQRSSDHQVIKRGIVCIYYIYAVYIVSITSLVTECLVCEVTM